MPAIPGSVTVMGMITIRPHNRNVDEQGDIGDDAERPVDDEQQEKHEPEPDERGQKPALQGTQAQRRTYCGLGDHLHVDGKRARVEHGLQLLGLVLGKTIGQPVVGDRDVLAQWFLHGRRALDVLIERDGEPRRLTAGERVVHHLLGKVPHLPAALRGELQAHDALPVVWSNSTLAPFCLSASPVRSGSLLTM